jgi:hypothetical protein
MSQKPITILYCDDEETTRNKFKNDHSDEFNIEIEPDINTLIRKLLSRKTLPNLLVLDLYHPNAEVDLSEAQKLNEEINITVQEINRLIKVAKQQNEPLFKPRAIRILKEIRDSPKLSKMPVLLYTRYGICTIDDEEIKEAISLSAEWLLKGRVPSVEKAVMHRVIDSFRKSKV